MSVSPDQQPDSAYVEIRDLTQSDLPALFTIELDPIANEMAALYPRDRQSFDTHWDRSLNNPAIVAKAILADGQFVGIIGCFTVDEMNCVGYRVARPFWGRGIATRALQLLLQEVHARPLYAFVASHNMGSIAVLHKCNFVPVERRHSPESERFRACEEIVMRLQD